MKNNLFHLLDAFKGLNILVIGEGMLDSYLHGEANRLCREAPVPVVNITHHRVVPGGAANTAVNVHGLGARVTFLSVLGDDAKGHDLKSILHNQNINTEPLILHPSRHTLAKHRIISSTQMLLRYDEGSTFPIDLETESRLIHRLTELFPQHDGIIVSDYGYGILTPSIINALAELQTHHPRPLVVDAKKLLNYRRVGLTAVKPNYQEAVHLLDYAGAPESKDRLNFILDYGNRILDLTGAEIAAVTLDQEGALLFEHHSQPYRTYAEPRPNSHATGAGDTFTAALTLSLAAGADSPTAAEIASAAASIVVNRDGTTICSIAELRGLLSSNDKCFGDSDSLAARVNMYHKQNRRIVFTNGCFDILHRGHIAYLNRAKELGDILIVGVNSDASVRRLKGADRPINILEDRLQVLAALSCVDHLIAFEENTPETLIQIIRPDIFVKGGDYTRETLPEAELIDSLGGVVVFLPYLPDRSTTGLIKRIRQTTYTETIQGKKRW